MKNQTPCYRGFRFPPEIFSHAIWLYHRFSLSFREVEKLLAERGIIVIYEFIPQWCQRFGPAYARNLKRRQGRLGNVLYIDKAFIRYCQLGPDLADWTCGAHNIILDNPMDSFQPNCVLRVKFSLSRQYRPNTSRRGDRAGGRGRTTYRIGHSAPMNLARCSGPMKKDRAWYKWGGEIQTQKPNSLRSQALGVNQLYRLPNHPIVPHLLPVNQPAFLNESDTIVYPFRYVPFLRS